MSQSLLLLSLVECKSEWIMNEMSGLSRFITVDRSHPLMPCPWLFNKYVSLFPLNYLLVIIVEIARHEEQVRLLLATRHSGGPLVINHAPSFFFLFIIIIISSFVSGCPFYFYQEINISRKKWPEPVARLLFFFLKGGKCSLNVDVLMCIDEQ